MYLCKIQPDRKVIKFSDSLLLNQNFRYDVLQAYSDAKLNLESKK